MQQTLRFSTETTAAFQQCSGTFGHKVYGPMLRTMWTLLISPHPCNRRNWRLKLGILHKTVILRANSGWCLHILKRDIPIFNYLLLFKGSLSRSGALLQAGDKTTSNRGRSQKHLATQGTNLKEYTFQCSLCFYVSLWKTTKCKWFMLLFLANSYKSMLTDFKICTGFCRCCIFMYVYKYWCIDTMIHLYIIIYIYSLPTSQ